MRENFHLVVAIGLASIFAAGLASADALDGRAILSENCASCHNLSGPAPATYDGVLGRKAPDLFYAGSKFKRSWLVDWLQNPSPIRQTGVMFLNHVTTDNGIDRIVVETVKPCPVKLSPETAEAVASHLMTLKDMSMKTGVVDMAKKFRKPKAYRLFTKQLPCVGCHTVKFGKRILGGVSGPDLTQAGKRLNPDWVYARIENPQYWDPRTWMPRVTTSHKKRELLTLFIGSME